MCYNGTVDPDWGTCVALNCSGWCPVVKGCNVDGQAAGTTIPPTPSSCWRRERELTSPAETPGSRQVLFHPGDCFVDGRASVCYRIPSLIAAGNRTLLAFAKAFNFSSDGCYPKPWWCGPGHG